MSAERFDRIDAKLDRLAEKVTELGVRGEVLVKVEERLVTLERWQLKLLGAAAAIALLAGAAPQLLAPFLHPAAHLVEHAAAEHE